MNFLKSVFSDEPTPPDSPESAKSPDAGTTWSPESSNPPESRGGWTFGLLIESYRKELEEFGSELRKETALIRDVASRAITDLPNSLEAGASVAQDSLESVGQAVDVVGATVWKSTAQFISNGRDSIVDARRDKDRWSGAHGNSSERRESFPVRYSRLEAIQGDPDTYCKEPDDTEAYEKWRLRCFVLRDKREEIEGLVSNNGVVSKIYNEVVPSRVSNEGFWSRYFYRLHKVKQAEEAKDLLVKRAIAGEEGDELSWDLDDDDDGKGESSGNAEDVEKKGAAGQSTEVNVAEKGKKSETSGDENGKSEMNNGEDYEDMDVSVVSRPEEDDSGWDELEEIGGSNDGSRREEEGERSVVMTKSKVDDLRKRLSSAGEEEDLSWDIEDGDDDV